LSAALAATLFAGTAIAAPVTFSFSGDDNFFNEGLPGFGAWSGSITIDPDAATPNSLSYPGAVTNIYLNINGSIFQSLNDCTDITCNSVSPVNLAGGQDALVANYEGGFSSNNSIVPDSVFFDIRTDANLFSDPSNLFDTLTAGQTINLNDFNSYFQLSIGYVGATSVLDATSLSNADLGGYSLTVGPMAAVPLPAGLPLLAAGLGAFGIMRRRKG